MAEGVRSTAAEEVRAELHAVLATAAFVRSPRLGRLLAHLCNKTLAGEADQIKEYTIGVEVMDRPASFNPADDAIARVEVHRLRKRLKEYYEGEGAAARIRIEIPNGQYVPVFIPAGSEHPLHALPPAAPLHEVEHWTPAPRPARPAWFRYWPWAAGGLALIAAAILFLSLRKDSSPTARRVEVVPPISLGAAPTDAVRIACGQQQPHVDRMGRQWGADAHFEGGTVIELPRQYIARAFNPKLFQYARAGNFSYHIPLAPGVYQLQLYFIETAYGPGAPGGAGEHSRVFDVFANDHPILTDFDILSDADGPFIADPRVFKNISPAADGELHLSFRSKREQARISAIEIVPARPRLLNPVRIYLQDSPYTDSNGNEWLPENYMLGGQIATHPMDVSGTRDAELYTAERYGHFSYAIPVDAGTYRLSLYFAEKFFGPGSPSGGGGAGSRLFNVFCNGTALMRDYDMLKESGPNRAIVKTFTGLKANAQGKLVIDFVPVRDYASLYAIEVVDQGE